MHPGEPVCRRTRAYRWEHKNNGDGVQQNAVEDFDLQPPGEAIGKVMKCDPLAHGVDAERWVNRVHIVRGGTAASSK